jgi:hypothetical protein
MRRLLTLLAFAVAFGLGGPIGSEAQDATPVAPSGDAPVVLPLDEEAYGATYPEWVARSAQWYLSFSEEASPFLDPTGERCTYGQHGPVFFLEAGEPGTVRSCTVPAGKALLVPVVGSSCSTVEPPPFFGRDEPTLQACAQALFDTPTSVSLSVNGAAVPNVEQYRVQSTPFTVALPEGNLLGLSPVVATTVLEGYFVLLAPLPPGEHEVRFGFSMPEVGAEGDVTYRLTVAEPVVVEPTPEATPAT